MDAVGVWADGFTIATGLVAILALFASTRAARRSLLGFRLRWARRRSLRNSLRRLPDSTSLGRLVRSRVEQSLSGMEPTVASEVAWLARTRGIQSLDEADGDWLRQLAGGYRALAARLEVRSLLVGSQPLLEREARVATSTAAWLETLCAGRAVDTPDPSVHVDGHGGDVTLYPSIRGFCGVDLVVSWSRRRQIVGGPTGSAPSVHPALDLVAVPMPDGFEAVIDDLRRTPYFYDGVLPTLLTHRTETDVRTGRPRLHLTVGETTYLAHRAMSSSVNDLGSDDGWARVLTLTLLPVTSDGFGVIVRRAGGGYYAGQLGAGANGNLDITSPADFDDLGLPDPVAAAAREAREEIGLDVDRTCIRVHGLARLNNKEEHGTWVLLMTADIPETFDQVVASTRHADPAGGGWELGDEMYGLPIPSRDEAAKVTSWLWHSSEVSPHLASVATALLGNLGLLPQDGRPPAGQRALSAPATREVLGSPRPIGNVGPARRPDR